MLVLINLLNGLIFKNFKVVGTHFIPDARDIDLNELPLGGFYDYPGNVITWLMIESCSNYLNLLLYTSL